MKQIACPECKQPINGQREACDHCGSPMVACDAMPFEYPVDLEEVTKTSSGLLDILV